MIALLLALTQGPAPVPARPGALRLVPRGDTVVVFLTWVPARGGYLVYRSLAGAPPVRLTAAPVTAARSGSEAGGIIGPDLEAVRRALRAVSADDALRRLVRDPFAALVMSALYPRVGIALGRTFLDVTASRGAVYTYRVVVTDSTGRETALSYSGRVRVADVPPPPPSGLKARGGARDVTLSWSYPAFRGDSGAADNVIGFLVYRADAPGAPFHRITPLPVIRNDAGALELHDAPAVDGLLHQYRVTALDLSGQEGPASAPVDYRAVDRTPPAPPQDVVARPVAGGVAVVWRLSPDPDATGYFVERGTRSEGPYTRLTTQAVPVGTPAFTDSTARGGIRYFYRVDAVDASGNVSAPSNPNMVMTGDVTAPDAPTRVTAAVRARHVALHWRPVSAPDLRGYYVYRVGPGGDTTRLTSAAVRDTAFEDAGPSGKGLRPGARYQMLVTAVDSAGNESARLAALAVAAAIPDDDPPAPATGLAARNVEGRYVELTWSASPSGDTREYVLTRRRDSAVVTLGHFTGRPPFLVRDTAVSHGVRYVYSVTTVDSAGNRGDAATDTVLFGRVTPPPAPRHVAVRRAAAGVTLLWERVADPELAGYRVYRSAAATGGYALLTRRALTATTFADSTGAPAFYYQVRAVDRSGNESGPSPAVRVGSAP